MPVRASSRACLRPGFRDEELLANKLGGGPFKTHCCSTCNHSFRLSLLLGPLYVHTVVADSYQFPILSYLAFLALCRMDPDGLDIADGQGLASQDIVRARWRMWETF